ncbi:MAG: hypothetical protein LBI99_01140 [Propionibacteriaceae bacterium]|jgi:N-acetylglucosamine kinase-like BadF-type ATPase|nr:hypothetical protein [Propionibacteriaceae bacterium]
MSLHLAVDGGNSKTVALLLDETGAVLGRGRTGCADIYNAEGPESAVAALSGAVAQAMSEAGAASVDNAAFRIAGVDWPEDSDWWREQITRRLPAIGSFSVTNDALATLRLGRLDGTGLAITIGTGPAIGARSSQGREAWSGWWIFDNLGGWGLAETAVAAVCRAWMGIGPPTALTARLLELFNEPDVWSLRHAYTRRFGARDHGELLQAARAVLEIAQAGDQVALGIVADQAASFVGHASWVADRAGMKPVADVPIILNGSIATSEHGVLRELLLGGLAEKFPGGKVIAADAPPIAGCALDALAEGGIALTGRLRDRVAASNHPPAFLST